MAVCIIHCFISCSKMFFPLKYTHFWFPIICLFPSSEMQQNRYVGQNGQQTDERQLVQSSPRGSWLEGRLDEKRLHTPTGTCQKQVLEESSTQLNRGIFLPYFPLLVPTLRVFPKLQKYRNAVVLSIFLGLAPIGSYCMVCFLPRVVSIQRFFYL